VAKIIKTIMTDMPAFQNGTEYGAGKVPSVSGNDRSEVDQRNNFYGKSGKTKDPKDGKAMLVSTMKDRRW
jgi:hypothetical protein